MVPTRNRPDRLARCVAALRAQIYPRESYDVVVVDDGGEQGVEDVLAPFRTDVALTILRQANAGPAAARNHGASIATGDLLAFTDDDCEPAADWLARLSEGYRQAPEAVIGGQTVNALTANRCAEASQVLVQYLYEYYDARQPTESPAPAAPSTPRFFTSNNLAVPTALFKQVGGFDVSFGLAAGEDREFCDRWQHAGYPLIYEPRAVVRHAHALSLPRFWRQHFHYGRGAWHFRAARRRRQVGRVGIEPLSFYRNLVLYPVRQRGLMRGAPLAALLSIAQVANAAGYWRERIAAPRAPVGRSAP